MTMKVEDKSYRKDNMWLDVVRRWIETFAAAFLWAMRFLVSGDSDMLTAVSSKEKESVYYRNKVVWVTGGSSGIGAALAKHLVDDLNAKVIITARDEKALKEVKLSARRDKRDNIFVLPADLMDLDKLPEVAKAAEEAFGCVDILVNNAGIAMRADFEVFPFEEGDLKILQLDLLSPIKLTKLMLPNMLKRGFGQIVVVSSLAGKVGCPTRTAYCAAKFGLMGYFEAMDLECIAKALPIKVSLVCPGYVNTGIPSRAISKGGKNIESSERWPQIEKGMPAERCAELMTRAVSSGNREVWIARQPELFATYAHEYCPFLFDISKRYLARWMYNEAHKGKNGKQ